LGAIGDADGTTTTSTPLTDWPGETLTAVGVVESVAGGGAGLLVGDVPSGLGEGVIPDIMPRPPQPASMPQTSKMDATRHTSSPFASGAVRTPVYPQSCKPSVTIQELTFVR
jgi:hypothetical protein